MRTMRDGLAASGVITGDRDGLFVAQLCGVVFKDQPHLRQGSLMHEVDFESEVRLTEARLLQDLDVVSMQTVVDVEVYEIKHCLKQRLSSPEIQQLRQREAPERQQFLFAGKNLL